MHFHASSFFTRGLGGPGSRVNATSASEVKIKKSDKKSSFTPFSDDEKKCFRTVATSLSSSTAVDDHLTRPITAIDDFMQAMKYAEDLVVDSWTHGNSQPTNMCLYIYIY